MYGSSQSSRKPTVFATISDLILLITLSVVSRNNQNLSAASNFVRRNVVLSAGRQLAGGADLR